MFSLVGLLCFGWRQPGRPAGHRAACVWRKNASPKPGAPNLRYIVLLRVSIRHNMIPTTRRAFLRTAIAGLMGAAPGRGASLDQTAGRHKPLFHYSICNELFEKWDFADSCRAARKFGYEGLEIAPFTLADSVDDISNERRKQFGRIIESEGLKFAGLHWLLVTPKWLHITTAQRDVRERSWHYFRKLVDFCGDLESSASTRPAGAVMVLGSPKQRGTQGNTAADARWYLAEGLANLAPQAAARRITICLEALDHSQTDVVNTLAEAVAVVREVNHPAIQTMFDFHNTADEKEPVDLLVERYYPMICHVHINEMDGRHPGTGHYDFRPVLEVLKNRKYSGWVSLEVFDFKEGAERIGRAAMEYLRKLETQLS